MYCVWVAHNLEQQLNYDVSIKDSIKIRLIHDYDLNFVELNLIEIVTRINNKLRRGKNAPHGEFKRQNVILQNGN